MGTHKVQVRGVYDARPAGTEIACWWTGSGRAVDEGKGGPGRVVQDDRTSTELRKWYHHDPERFQSSPAATGRS